MTGSRRDRLRFLVKSEDTTPLELMIYNSFGVDDIQACGLYKNTRVPRNTGIFGAGSRGRTDTVLLPSDFESDASANSTIPASALLF